MDILKRKTTQAGPVECSIARPDSAQVAPVDLHVESQWLRVCTVREMEAADLEAQQNQLGLAQDRLKKVEESIYKSPAYNSENALLMALESNVKAIRTNFQSTSSYDNVGGHQSKNIYNSLRRQRAMVSSEASAAPYQTSRKKKMANAFSRSTQK
jgi:hypothetical protein